MSKSDSYILGVGEKAALRLQIQSKLYEGATLDLLKRAGLRKNMKVLEIACGAAESEL